MLMSLKNRSAWAFAPAGAHGPPAGVPLVRRGLVEDVSPKMSKQRRQRVRGRPI